MPDDVVVRVDLPRPSWLVDPVISVGDAADLLGLPEPTLSHWLKMADALGVPMHRKVASSRRMTPHDVYRAAILRALYKTSFPASNWVFLRTHEVTYRQGLPVLPGLLDQAEFVHPAIDGKPEARVLVDLSAVWLNIEPSLAKLAGGAR